MNSGNPFPYIGNRIAYTIFKDFLTRQRISNLVYNTHEAAVLLPKPMKRPLCVYILPVVTSALLFSERDLHAQNLQLLSSASPAQLPAGGGGGSYFPIATPDGRYVAFASTAPNLCVMSNNLPMPGPIPSPLNVYLRDRLYGTNTLVSVNLSGVAGGNADSAPAGISTDGRYVVFESSASDLVANDTNAVSDVFVRDLVAGTTVLVSVATNGVPGNGASRSPAVTPDGRYVAFVSAAYNLVPLDTNRIADIFVRDLQNNVTVLASVGAISTTLTGSSEAPLITDDGRYVAFYSTATNLVSGVPAGGDIYIRDLVASNTIWASTYARTAIVTNTVTSCSHVFSADSQSLAYVAVGSSPTLGISPFGTILRYSIDTGVTDVVETNAYVPRTPFEEARSLDISDDGRFIVYVANYISRDGSTSCIKLWDAQSGQSTIVSGNLSDIGVVPGSYCDWPAIDASGRYVAFLSSATNMVTNATPGECHLYLHDNQMSRTTLLDAGPDGVGTDISPASAPRLAPDASFVLFECADSNLVPGDSNHETDVFFRNLATGSIELISAHDPVLSGATPTGPSTLTANSLSADGRYAAFASEADNIVPGDTNRFRDIFVRDLADGTTRLVSAATNGFGADGMSSEPATSADGRYIAFTSQADNLTPGDNNRNQDVFLFDQQSRTISLVSVKTNGAGAGNNMSYSPQVSANGRFVMFNSRATDLAPGSYALGSINLIQRDTQLGTNFALTTGGIVSGSMTPDGRYVAFTDTSGAMTGRYYIWDSVATVKITMTAAPFAMTVISISPDANRFAAVSGTKQLWVADRNAGTNWTMISGPAPTATSVLRFSGDSQVLVYNGGINNTNQVYSYDFGSGANTLISFNYASGLPGNGASDMPTVSPEGRFIAYRSAASDIVRGDNNGQPDIFLYDGQTGTNTLLSVGQLGNTFPINRSLTPVFSADGSTLVFESWASDLTSGDFNHSSDIFGTIFLKALLLPVSSTLGEGPWISWSWTPGHNYRVEFKNDLGEANWQELSGTITNLGSKAWLRDPAPDAAHRFYRVHSF